MKDNEKFDYICIQAVFEKEDKPKYERTCLIKTADVRDVCDLAKDDLSSDIKLKSCNACQTNDNCNDDELGKDNGGIHHFLDSSLLVTTLFCLYYLYK